jgi:autotransporter-associated beta strand protein
VGKLILGNSEVLGNGSTLQIGTNNSAGAAVLDLNGFSETVGAITLGSGTMNADALGGLGYSIVNTGDSAGFLKMNGNLTYNAGPTDKQHGLAAISANIDLNGATRTFTINNSTAVAQDVVISGNISGSAGLTKAQAGVLALSGTNTYSGTTTVSAGVLQINSASALPAGGALTLGGGVLGLGNADFTRALGTGGNQVRLINSNSGFAAYGADRIVNIGGTSAPLTWGTTDFMLNTATPALVQTSMALGSATATHTVDFQNPINLGTVAGSRTFNIADGAAVVDAVISGAISVTALGPTAISKTGTGTLKLGNPGNAYPGSTFIDCGTLLLGAAGVIPDASTVVAKRNKGSGITDPVLDLNGFNEIINGLTLGGRSDEVSAITNGQKPSVISSGGPATLTVGFNNGGITYNGGSPEFPCDQATVSVDINIGTGNRNIVVADGMAAEDLVISGTVSGSAGITKTNAGGTIPNPGTGTLVLAKPAYSGNTTVNYGTLTLGAANPNNDVSTVTVASGATLNLTYTGTDKVKVLVINGVTLPDGEYGRAGSASPVIENPQITGDGTITVASDPYEAWAGAGVAFDADANNDGVENGLAWLLGAANKDINALGLLPKPEQAGGGLKLTFSMLNAASRGTATVQLQHSSDLGLSDAWTPVAVPDTTGIVDGVDFTIGTAGNMNTVTAIIPSTESAGGKLFSRLKGVK